MAGMRLVPAAYLTILVQAEGGRAASWWASRSPARFDAEISGGGGFLPFEDSWTTTAPFEEEAPSGMMVLGMRGGVGWTHPSGVWGADAELGGGPRLSLFETDTTTGSFAIGNVVLRWDPFCKYQIAPIFGLGLSAWTARQHVWVGEGGFLFGYDETWGYVDQKRYALALGTRSGFRFGWFEAYSDVSWPVVSRSSKSLARVDPAWSGRFSKTESNLALQVGYALRIPIHAFDEGDWETDRKAYAQARDSARKSNTWSVGYEWSNLPPAWIWKSVLDKTGGGMRSGLGVRWDIALPTRSDRGLSVGFHEGTSIGEHGGIVEDHGSVNYGVDAGAWWIPVVGDPFSLRSSGTVGLWKARATARTHSTDAEEMESEWSGVRLAAGARAETRFFYLGGKVCLDFVTPGRLVVPQGIEQPVRADRIALGGAFETGFQYRF